MATTKKKKKTAKKKVTKKQQEQQKRMIYFFVGLAFVLIGLFGTLKLGFLGTLITNAFRLLVGNTYAVLGVLTVFLGLYVMIVGKNIKIEKPKKVIGCVLIYLAVLIFLHAKLFHSGVSTETNIMNVTWENLLLDVKHSEISTSIGGGMLGGLMYSGTYFLVDQLGTYLIVGILAIIGICLIFGINLEDITHFVSATKNVLGNKIAKSSERQADKANKKAAQKAAQLNEAEQRQQQLELEEQENRKNQVRPITPGEELAKQMQEEVVGLSMEEQVEQATQLSMGLIPEVETSKKKATTEQDSSTEGPDFEIKQEHENEAYHLPPASLLAKIPIMDQSSERGKIKHNLHVLERTFESFGVDAKVVNYSLGPAVTKYEIQPAIGVKVSKIVGLTDDLALALAAKDIRMEAPIPGKSLIGIEVPNSAISMVSFRDVIESQPKDRNKILEVPLGRDISGDVISADLAKMPHLLIAGSTGSGKSVCINGIITSILMRAKPHEVKMMMIDPKMVELNVYNGIPHLLTPVVTNPRKAAQALQKVVQEMEQRYEKFASFGVRNITGYNEMIHKHNIDDGEKHPIMPFIVVIVDELADLMMVASNEVEDAIIRLAQMARAAGIHMILATQRPSVDVITGIIKANVPSRIAFAVSSGTDSRTIIDSNGAEKLLGRGDMLFLPMGENKPIRVQGAFISDNEVEDIVSYVTNQQQADYQENMMPTDEPTTSTGESQDDLYQEAIAMVVEMDAASISMLQRRFRIGYNRAARLIDEMEANGIVGPSEGSKPRKVLVSTMALGEDVTDEYSENKQEQLPIDENSSENDSDLPF